MKSCMLFCKLDLKNVVKREFLLSFKGMLSFFAIVGRLGCMLRIIQA